MFRIKEYPKGFVVEIKKKRFLLKDKWVHFVSVFGIPSEPWYHKTAEYARMSLMDEIDYDVINNSNPKIFKQTT